MSPDLGVRGRDVATSPDTSHHDRTTKFEGPLGNSTGPHTSKTAPSILIEPNTSLELTEEIVLGTNNVMSRDTPYAKASGSDKHETGVSAVPCSGLAGEINLVRELNTSHIYWS